jgi:hypothetical protein
MKSISYIILSLVTLANLLFAEATVDQKAVENLELNIRVLKEQYDNTVEQIVTLKTQIPRKLGPYEGTLVGRYQLEDQIRRQEAKLYSLTTGKEKNPELLPELTVLNNTPLKLLITLHSSDPAFDRLDYFTFPEMEIHFPIHAITWVQISDFREDSIYPIYKVDEIRSDKKLILKLEGFSYTL